MSQKITNIGELRDKVTFTRIETTDDGMGGVTTSDKTICTEWAFDRGPSTRDGVVGGADAESRSHVVRVRQNATPLGIDINDKATWRNRTLTVKGVRPDGHEWIDFDCVVVDK